MVAKTTQMVGDEDELTPAQLKSAAYYQSPEGLAKLDANQKTAANINALKQQILGQNQTSKWTGEGYGSAEKNANAMAEMLAKAGITDIKQFGKVDKYEPVEVVGYSLNGKQVQNPSKGVYYESIPEPDGEGGISGYRRRDLTPAEIAQVKTQYGVVDTQTDEVRPASNVVERDGKLVGVTGQTFGNKATGQAIESGYGRWQNQGGENLFGGTGEGKGNTGYRVQFADDGTPIFYTTKGTSNDLAQLMTDLGPIGQIGLAVATGGMSLPAQIATNMAIQVLSGQDLGDAIKNAAVSIAVAQIPGTDFMKDVGVEINKLGLDPAIANTVNNAAQNAAMSATRAALTGQDVFDAALKGAAAGGVNGAVSEIMKSIPDFDKLTKAQQRMASNAVVGVISGKPLDQIAINTAIAAANAEIAEQKKYAPLDEKAIAELDPEEKKIYDTLGTRGLKQYSDEQKAAAKAANPDVDALAKSGLTSTDTVNITDAKNTQDFLDSIFKNATPNKDSGLSNQDIEDLINGRTPAKPDDTVTVTTKVGTEPPATQLPYLPTDDDFVPTIRAPEVVVTDKSTAPTPTDDILPIFQTPVSPKAPDLGNVGNITVVGDRPAPTPPLDLSTDPVKLITDPLQTPTLPPAAQPPAAKPPASSTPSINIDPVKALETLYNPFAPSPASRSTPSQTDTGPIQLMTDVFGTNIASAQKTGARGYGFSAGGDIDELLRLLRS